MRVFPVHTRDSEHGFRTLFGDLARQDRIGQHTLVTNAADADIILFLDLNELAPDFKLTELRNHPLVKAYPEKSFVYCENDQPWCVMQGLYVSMPSRHFQMRRQRACGYIARSLNGKLSADAAAAVKPDLLWSFAGRIGNSLRRRLLELPTDRAVAIDTSKHNFFQTSTGSLTAAEDAYAETIYRSKFVLCPRGAGTSSYRLFEAMQVGRVPVIISDDWMPVDGPDWNTCSIRIAENNVPRIPAILQHAETNWPAMATQAAQAWSQYFADDILWHRMIESCADIMRSRGLVPERIRRYMPNWRYLHLWVRHAKASLLARDNETVASAI